MSEIIRSAGKVLVVDDIEANVELLRDVLTQEGYTVCAAYDGEAALEAVARETPDLVILDVMMPKLDGFDVCRRLKQDPATRLTPVVLVTSLSEREHKIEGINAGADDFLAKPVDTHELKARARSLVRLKHYTDDLESAEAVILGLALTIEARDAYTQGHCERLAIYATALGAQLGLRGEDLAALHRGGFLHDVGKVGIPDAVLLKEGPLAPAEYEVMKRHTVIGNTLCGEFRSLRAVRPIVRHHHERLDGSGYPDGLQGDGIPLLAQIMGVVDVYDALTTARPYRSARLPETAYEELTREAQKGWRRHTLVAEFITLARDGLERLPVMDLKPSRLAPAGRDDGSL
jgi:putative two-component system response regulator